MKNTNNAFNFRSTVNLLTPTEAGIIYLQSFNRTVMTPKLAKKTRPIFACNELNTSSITSMYFHTSYDCVYIRRLRGAQHEVRYRFDEPHDTF